MASADLKMKVQARRVCGGATGDIVGVNADDRLSVDTDLQERQEQIQSRIVNRKQFCFSFIFSLQDKTDCPHFIEDYKSY